MTTVSTTPWRSMSLGKGVLGPVKRWLTPTTLLTVAFAVVLIATWAYFVHLMRGFAVMDDDVASAQLGHHLRDYIEPYGGTLALVPIAIYQMIYRIFGFTHYKPLAVLGVGSQMAVALVAFLVVRSRVGPALAFLAGVALLWYPKADLFPSVFNHFFALAAIIVCSWALRKPGRKYDVVIAVALAFGLCNSPVAVAGAAGCMVYLALARAPFRRWFVVVIPTAGYAVWWLIYNRRRPPGARGQTVGDMVRYVWDGIMGAFRGLAFDVPVLGVLLAVGFVALFAWRLRFGLRGARHEVAWTVALVAWFAGLAFDRGVLPNVKLAPFRELASPEQFRYRLVGSAFIILACLPDKRWSAVVRRAVVPWCAVAGVAIGVLFVLMNNGDIVARADGVRALMRQERALMIAANLGPNVVPDNASLPLIHRRLSARDYRHLVAEFGAPGGTTPAHPDSAIVTLRDIKPTPVQVSGGDCVPLADPTELPPLSRLVLRAGSLPVTVRIRRFEDGFVPIGTIRARTTARIDLPSLLAITPWMVSAPGACRIGTSPSLPRG